MSRVRGPTSALTEFLRERGITANNADRFRRRNDDQAVQLEQPSDSGANTSSSSLADPPTRSDATGSTTNTPRQRPRRSAAVTESMNFDEEQQVDSEDTDVEETRTEQQQTATMRSRGQSAVTKKRKKDDDDDDDEHKDDANNNRASTSNSSRSNFSYANRAPGSISYCGMCKAKFTITQYTKISDKGSLCHRCGPLYKDAKDNGKSSAATKKKRAPRRKINGFQNDHHQSTLPSLQSFCIDIIGRHIQDAETLGHMGWRNMDALCKAISKNRNLNPKTVQLFLNPSITTLSLYDCSKLDSESLQSIATFAPNIETLCLHFCGRLDNDALDAWGQMLTKLKRIELDGPYLVRTEGWQRFFASVGSRLESFKIRVSSRFDLACIQAMVEHCPNVCELGLAQIGQLNAEMLKPLEKYAGQLTYLDISEPGVSAPGTAPLSLKDEAVVSLLTQLGPGLLHLDLTKNADLTDCVVTEALTPHCHQLEHLCMLGLEKIQPQCIADMFTSWSQKKTSSSGGGLRFLSLERMTKLTDIIVSPLLTHSSSSLIQLSLNSVDLITETGFKLLGSADLINLQTLDVSFCRAIDDVTLIDLCTRLAQIKTIWVFGCNRISDFVNPAQVRMIGKERYAR